MIIVYARISCLMVIKSAITKRISLGVLWMRFTVVGTASYDGFSCQLLFHRKEELAGNALQTS